MEFACYRFIPDHLNWTEASDRCRDDGGVGSHLAAITTPEKNAFTSREITRGVKAWIGGSQDPPNGNLEFFLDSMIIFKYSVLVFLSNSGTEGEIKIVFKQKQHFRKIPDLPHLRAT